MALTHVTAQMMGASLPLHLAVALGRHCWLTKGCQGRPKQVHVALSQGICSCENATLHITLGHHYALSIYPAVHLHDMGPKEKS